MSDIILSIYRNLNVDLAMAQEEALNNIKDVPIEEIITRLAHAMTSVLEMAAPTDQVNRLAYDQCHRGYDEKDRDEIKRLLYARAEELYNKHY